MSAFASRWVMAGVFGLLVLSGCGTGSSSNGGGHAAAPQAKPVSVRSAVSPVTPTAAGSSGTVPQAVGIGMHAQYAAMCQMKLDEMKSNSEAAHVLDKLPHLCDCVADKLEEGVKIAREQGNEAAKQHMNDAMIDCVPGARDRQTADNGAAPAASADSGFGLGGVSLKREKSPSAAHPERQLRYDPKTKTWIN